MFIQYLRLCVCVWLQVSHTVTERIVNYAAAQVVRVVSGCVC